MGPHYLKTNGHRMLEIPVTTIPLLRIPFHLSYLMYLGQKSRKLMRAYFVLALSLCRTTGTPPSFLLHPLDFLDVGEAPELAFFPAMSIPWQEKLEIADEVLTLLASRYTLLPMSIPWQEKLEIADEVLTLLASRYTLLPMSSFAEYITKRGLPSLVVEREGESA